MIGKVKSIARRMVPEASRSRLSLLQARRGFDAFMVGAVGGFHRPPGDDPVPPPDVTVKTSALDEASFDKRTLNRELNANAYLRSGYNDLHGMLRQAIRCGLNLRTVSTVFELGCGDGRLIRHLRAIDGIRLVGSDTRPEAIEWCRQNIPGIDFHVSGFDPPLDFLADGSVDLAYAFSVFTHIPLDAQEAWTAEMLRVLRPGGFCLITVIGQSLKDWLPAHRREELRRKGELELSSSDAEAHLATRIGGSLWDIYRSRGRILDQFARHFDVRDYLCEGLTGEELLSARYAAVGQDLVVLQKPRTEAQGVVQRLGAEGQRRPSRLFEEQLGQRAARRS